MLAGQASAACPPSLRRSAAHTKLPRRPTLSHPPVIFVLALAWWQGPKALRTYRAGIEAERQRAAAEVEAREAVRDRRLQAILEQMRKP